MAFQLRPNETVAHGLRRLATKELKTARKLLRSTTPKTESVHEARKSVKKVRTIVELIDADEGRGLGRSRKRLKKVNRRLSKLRDADAMLEILRKLRDTKPESFDEHGFARVRRKLEENRKTLRQSVGEDGVRAVVRDLKALRRSARGWRPSHRRFGAVAAGVDAAFRQGRDALARANRRQRADDYHEWRKQMKALRSVLRLIEGCSPQIRSDVRLLHDAETRLGDDHNVVVLCRTLSRDTSLCDFERFRRGATDFQCAMRRKAIAGTKQIFAQRPTVYLQRVKQAWRAWRKRGPSADERKARAAA
jgi:CHAD domain-containing protein